MYCRILTLSLTFFLAGYASAQTPNETRLFELRTYHVPDGRMDALHARFRDHAAQLFEKHGITNLGYWVPADDAGPRIVFLLAYPDAAARSASWARLVVDPQWRKVRRESEKHGKLVERIEEVMLTPTADCPVVAPARAEAPRSFELRTYATKPGDEKFMQSIREKYRDMLVGSWATADATTHVVLLAHDRPMSDRVVPEVVFSDRFRISATVGATVPAVRPRRTNADGGKAIILHPTDYSPMR